MAEEQKEKSPSVEEKKTKPSPPLVFISHDSRDAALAEAFSKLLRSVSAGMLKSFRSSDKKGTEGIEFGDDWYKRLMAKLDTASDVVCLITERSLERPWILYEAGVAKGKLDTPVLGVALGVALGKVGTGPFYQFQNCDDSEESLFGLVTQLARRIPSLEPDEDVVRSQVQGFIAKTEDILSGLAEPGAESEQETSSDSATAKLLEELKVMFRDLPSRLEDQIADVGRSSRRKKRRRLHPRMFEEMFHMFPPEFRPVSLLMFASLVRDDAPWLSEMAMEAFRSLMSGAEEAISKVQRSARILSDLPMRPSLFEELGYFDSEEMQMLVMEGPRVLLHLITRCAEMRE